MGLHFNITNVETRILLIPPPVNDTSILSTLPAFIFALASVSVRLRPRPAVHRRFRHPVEPVDPVVLAVPGVVDLVPMEPGKTCLRRYQMRSLPGTSHFEDRFGHLTPQIPAFTCDKPSPADDESVSEDEPFVNLSIHFDLLVSPKVQLLKAVCKVVQCLSSHNVV